MSLTNLNKSPAFMEHQNMSSRHDSTVTFDEQVRTHTIPPATTTPVQPSFSLPGNLISLGPIAAMQQTEFGKVIVSNEQTILSQWEHIQNQESSVKRLSSGTNTDPHCLPSLRSKCPIKISDHYKDNERKQTAPAHYLDLHTEDIKQLCHGALEIAKIELRITKEDLQVQLVKFLWIVLENLLFCDQSINEKDQWSVALTKQERFSLISEKQFCKFLYKVFSTYHSSNHRMLSLPSTTFTTPAASQPLRKWPRPTEKSKRS